MAGSPIFTTGWALGRILVLAPAAPPAVKRDHHRACGDLFNAPGAVRGEVVVIESTTLAEFHHDSGHLDNRCNCSSRHCGVVFCRAIFGGVDAAKAAGKMKATLQKLAIYLAYLLFAIYIVSGAGMAFMAMWGRP